MTHSEANSAAETAAADPTDIDFASIGLAAPILRAVERENYTTPTPIQARAIPHLLDGGDLVGIAQTGTGKTAAFVLPMLHRLAEDRQRPAPRACRALILAPTRELAQQIADSVRTYGAFARPSVAVVIGGAKPGPQIRALSRGVDVLVATPGRLLDHVASGAARLDQARIVVLDEADQMLDLGFMPAIRRIMGLVPARRQTALFSATMPAPIRALAADFLRNPTEVSVAPQARPIETIEQSVVLLEAAEKRAKLVEILADPAVERAIVFTRMKHGADRVARHLEAAGIDSAAIHGNKSQSQRQRALGAFRDGEVRVLVATDIAARGIDIDGVSHVVNFELPNVPESYVHRIGRTARAGATGVAISLCDASERPFLRDIEKLIGMRINGSPVFDGAKTAPRNAPRRKSRRPQRRAA